MASDISVANLITYITNAWDETIVALPEVITSDFHKNPKGFLTIHRRAPVPTWIAANVKQIDDVFELMLSHPTEASIDHLLDILMAYPGGQPAIFGAEGFETGNSLDLGVGGLATDGVRNNSEHHTDAWSLRVAVNLSGYARWHTTDDTALMYPTYISCWVKSTVSNRFIIDCGSYLGGGVINHCIVVGVDALTDNNFRWYTALGSTSIGIDCSAGWHHIEFKFIKYGPFGGLTKGTYQLFIDDVDCGSCDFFGEGTNPNCYNSEFAVQSLGANVLFVDDIEIERDGGIDLNFVPVSVSEPNHLGQDSAGNHVWELQFKASRWE